MEEILNRECMKLFIRNMACESCKIYIKDVLQDMKLHPLKVELGEVDIKEKLSEEKKKKFNGLIRKAGLELVENQGGVLIEKIKGTIRDYVHSNRRPSLNLSDYLSAKLKYDYTYLSNLFTEIEGVTITHYLSALKVEYAKELILFGNLKIAEVSEKLHYSYPSHFTAQFKKVTGFSPSHYMELKEKRRLAVHELTPHAKRKKQ
jgi:YesN/AraC family two-component response regulator